MKIGGSVDRKCKDLLKDLKLVLWILHHFAKFLPLADKQNASNGNKYVKCEVKLSPWELFIEQCECFVCDVSIKCFRRIIIMHVLEAEDNRNIIFAQGLIGWNFAHNVAALQPARHMSDLPNQRSRTPAPPKSFYDSCDAKWLTTNNSHIAAHTSDPNTQTSMRNENK